MSILGFAIEVNGDSIAATMLIVSVIGAALYQLRKGFKRAEREESAEVKAQRLAETASMESRVKAQQEVAKVYEDLYHAEEVQSHTQTKERLKTIRKSDSNPRGILHNQVLELNQ